MNMIYPANGIHLADVVLILTQRQRRRQCANIKTTSVQRLVFAELGDSLLLRLNLLWTNMR